MRVMICPIFLLISLFAFCALSEPECPSGKLNLNAATYAQIVELPGIGKKKAERILAYRKKTPFSRLTQLLDVEGIGKGTLKKLQRCFFVVNSDPHKRKLPKK